MAQTINNDLKQHCREVVLAEWPDAWAIYLYGSVARDDSGADSDVDLAVLLPPGQNIEQAWRIAGKLSVRLGRDVDLVDLRTVGDVLRMQVLQDGLVLYNASPGEVLAWEAGAMTRYAHYRFEVRELRDSFRKTGVGYGPER